MNRDSSTFMKTNFIWDIYAFLQPKTAIAMLRSWLLCPNLVFFI